MPDPIEESSSGGIDAAHFRTTLGHFPTGVTIITADGPDGPAGLAVGSFFSVSLEPPLVGFCPGKSSTNWPTIRQAGTFCVNVLAEDQEDLCRVFAAKGGDKFRGVGWSRTPSTGSPLLHDVLAWIDCEIVAIHDAGDHELCLGRVRALDVERRDGPLVFFRGGYGRFEP